MSDHYKQILSCVETAVNAYIPLKTAGSSSWCVPGWNDFVQDKHTAARMHISSGYIAVNVVVGTYFSICRKLGLISN